MSESMAAGLLHMTNGRFIKGIVAMLKNEREDII